MFNKSLTPNSPFTPSGPTKNGLGRPLQFKSGPGGPPDQPPGDSPSRGPLDRQPSPPLPPTHFILEGERITLGRVITTPRGDPPKVCFEVYGGGQRWPFAHIPRPLSELPARFQHLLPVPEAQAAQEQAPKVDPVEKSSETPPTPDTLEHQPDYSTYLAAALSVRAALFSLVIGLIDGSKMPSVKWKRFQTFRPSLRRVRRWFANNATRAIFVIMGRVSGNAEAIDIDEASLLAPVLAYIEERSPGLTNKLLIIETPRPGFQILYRCSVIGPNDDLAYGEREATEEESAKHRSYMDARGRQVVRWATIQTRGEGGYVVGVGSPLQTHKTGRPYRFTGGKTYADVVEITPSEREILFEACRRLSVAPPPRRQGKERAPKRDRQQGELFPGDDFNERGDVKALLLADGWQLHHVSEVGEHLTRPGKDPREGSSATLFSNHYLYVFSSSIPPFEANGVYSPFAYFTLTRAKGDFSRGASMLRTLGYGSYQHEGNEETQPRQNADPSRPIDVETKGWRDPQPIPDGLLPVSELPGEIIPKQFRAWIEDIADRMQVPLSFVAVPAIVCFAAVVGNQIRIRPKRHDDWTVVPNLWGAIVGRPGVMKSPPIAEVVRFLYRLQAKATKEHEKALACWQFEKEAAEVEQAALRDQMKRAAKNKASLDQFRDAFNGSMVPKEPKERRYIVNDVTVEKLGELLAENHNGLLLFRDELTGWLRSLDDERRKNDRAFMLESWNGDSSYTYHRIERGKIEIPNMTVSILGGIQPGPLEVYLRGALGYSEGDDGLMQRIQLAVYPDIQGWENVDRKPDYAARQAAFDAFEGASELAPEKIGAEFETITEKTEEGESVQKIYPYLHFAEAAQKFFDEWYIKLNRDLRSGVFEHPALEAHFSKYRSLMPSLALLFHLCDCLLDEEVGAVSLDAARKGVDWCAFLSEHAHRIFGLGILGATIHAKTLAKHLQKGDLSDGFTAREIYATKGWAGLSTAKIVEQALDILESLGWVSSLDVPTGGRPKTQYFINPKIKEVKL